jgi:sugar lactone lactonase YvrE
MKIHRILIAVFAITACHKNNPTPQGLNITSFTPTAATKGTPIQINGSGFTATATVTINGKSATITAATTTSLTVTVPTGAGDGKITVKENNQSATTTTDFTYLYTVTTIAGKGLPGFTDATGTNAAFDAPVDVKVGRNNNLIVADAINQRIRNIALPNATVTTIAGGDTGWVDGPVSQARFRFPYAIATDGSGNIYVADNDNNLIREITTANTVSTVAGDTARGYQNGTTARFDSPDGIAVDDQGNIYVSDAANHSIRKITINGVVSTLAGNGTPGWADGADARFHDPASICLDKSGNLYVADETNHAIRKIGTNGQTTTIAGNPNNNMGAFADGPGNTARFNRPLGIAVDSAGNLYIGDYGNNRIRKITPTGTVTTIAGDGTYGLKDGPGPTARFGNPCGIAVDKQGNIYVADLSNNCIRMLQ